MSTFHDFLFNKKSTNSVFNRTSPRASITPRLWPSLQWATSPASAVSDEPDASPSTLVGRNGLFGVGERKGEGLHLVVLRNEVTDGTGRRRSLATLLLDLLADVDLDQGRESLEFPKEFLEGGVDLDHLRLNSIQRVLGGFGLGVFGSGFLGLLRDGFVGGTGARVVLAVLEKEERKKGKSMGKGIVRVYRMVARRSNLVDGRWGDFLGHERNGCLVLQKDLSEKKVIFGGRD